MKALGTIDRNANGYESIDEMVCEEFGDYRSLGELVGELLAYFADPDHDDAALDFIRPMVQDYLNDRI